MMSKNIKTFDILIIGAGPSGCACASQLATAGFNVAIIEKQTFPRFSIGESLLPYNLELLKEIGLEKVFLNDTFRFKNGAQFLRGSETVNINFEDMSATGENYAYQVERGRFDNELTKIVKDKGVSIFFGSTIKYFTNDCNTEFNLPIKAEFNTNDKDYLIKAKYCIDATGSANVLATLLNLDIKKQSTNRNAHFGHIYTDSECSFDNDKILITTDKIDKKVWFWTIPLSKNMYSLGVITDSNEKDLNYYLDRNEELKEVLGNYKFIKNSKRSITAYTRESESSYGKNFVCVGNAQAFFDPIFSSGLTIALKSSIIASQLVTKILNGENVDWESQYINEVNKGCDIFKSFINKWYEGTLQDIIYSGTRDERIYKDIVSILAGYAWDNDNLFSKRASNKLNSIHALL